MSGGKRSLRNRSNLKRRIKRLNSSSKPTLPVQKVMGTVQKVMGAKRSLRSDSKNLTIEDCGNNNIENEVEHNLSQSEQLTSVMTRSKARMYKAVGAIHNKVDCKEELKIGKRWPPNIAYPAPEPYDDRMIVKDFSESLAEDEPFFSCDFSLKTDDSMKSQEVPEGYLQLEEKGFIDLSPFLLREPIVVNGRDETQITLLLNESLLPPNFYDMIKFTEDKDGNIIIQETEEDYKDFTGISHSSDLKADTLSILPYGPVTSVHNNHTYIQQYIDVYPYLNQLQSGESHENLFLVSDDEEGFDLEDGVKNLMLVEQVDVKESDEELPVVSDKEEGFKLEDGLKNLLIQ